MATEQPNPEQLAKAVQKLFGQIIQTRLCLAKTLDDFLKIIHDEFREVERRNRNTPLFIFFLVIRDERLMSKIRKELSKLCKNPTAFAPFHRNFVKIVNPSMAVQADQAILENISL